MMWGEIMNEVVDVGVGVVSSTAAVSFFVCVLQKTATERSDCVTWVSNIQWGIGTGYV